MPDSENRTRHDDQATVSEYLKCPLDGSNCLATCHFTRKYFQTAERSVLFFRYFRNAPNNFQVCSVFLLYRYAFHVTFHVALDTLLNARMFAADIQSASDWLAQFCVLG